MVFLGGASVKCPSETTTRTLGRTASRSFKSAREAQRREGQAPGGTHGHSGRTSTCRGADAVREEERQGATEKQRARTGEERGREGDQETRRRRRIGDRNRKRERAAGQAQTDKQSGKHCNSQRGMVGTGKTGRASRDTGSVMGTHGREDAAPQAGPAGKFLERERASQLRVPSVAHGPGLACRNLRR